MKVFVPILGTRIRLTKPLSFDTTVGQTGRHVIHILTGRIPDYHKKETVIIHEGIFQLVSYSFNKNYPDYSYVHVLLEKDSYNILNYPRILKPRSIKLFIDLEYFNNIEGEILEPKA